MLLGGVEMLKRGEKVEDLENLLFGDCTRDMYCDVEPDGEWVCVTIGTANNHNPQHPSARSATWRLRADIARKIAQDMLTAAAVAKQAEAGKRAEEDEVIRA
jgi:hypothetical protein